MVTKRPNPKRSITDSPWYWVCLFCTAGLMALLLLGPKFAHRQTQIERSAQGRQRAIQNLAGREPVTPLSDAQHTRINLQPLYVVLTTLILLAWGRLAWRHVRSRPAPQDPERSSPTAAS